MLQHIIGFAIATTCVALVYHLFWRAEPHHSYEHILYRVEWDAQTGLLWTSAVVLLSLITGTFLSVTQYQAMTTVPPTPLGGWLLSVECVTGLLGLPFLFLFWKYLTKAYSGKLRVIVPFTVGVAMLILTTNALFAFVRIWILALSGY